ncbi:hypothetical protein LY76DRAFT_132721 [Colletotrichum caudatum]|nr:hypothetical protein LY76DRAFT_132721 [Colletotrichum caudatum]
MIPPFGWPDSLPCSCVALLFSSSPGDAEGSCRSRSFVAQQGRIQRLPSHSLSPSLSPTRRPLRAPLRIGQATGNSTVENYFRRPWECQSDATARRPTPGSGLQLRASPQVTNPTFTGNNTINAISVLSTPRQQHAKTLTYWGPHAVSFFRWSPSVVVYGYRTSPRRSGQYAPPAAAQM